MLESVADLTPRQPAILVVDDEELSREFVRAELEKDHHVLGASTAEEAFRILDREAVDLVLMDVVMPGIGGFEACRQIKARAHDAFLPILFLTARKQFQDRYDGLLAGGDDFLTKPVDSKELRLRIRSYLRLREQDRTIRSQARSVERANERLRAVQSIGALLSSSLRLGEPHGWVVEAIAREFRLEHAAIGGPGPMGASVRGVAPGSEFDRAVDLLAAPEAARTLASGEFEIGASADGCRLLWVPIRDREGAFGILAAASRQPGALGTEDARALTTVCSQLALTLRNREFVARIEAHAEPLEAAVRERTASYERQVRLASQILDALPVSLHVVDRQRTVVAWNRQRELGSRGVLREQALGKSLYEVFDRQNREAIEAELGPIFEHGGSLCLERDSTADGELRHYRIHKLPMWLEPGDVTHVLSIGEDITEERRMEQTLAAAERMAALGRLAAGVAHEINNPLATILTCAEGLLDRVRDSAFKGGSLELEEYLHILSQEAERAKRITEELLDTGRPKASPRRGRPLSAILDRTLHLLSHHPGFGRIEVDRRFAAGLPDVEVDEEAIVQVFVALIRNAVDAMPEGGRLTVEAVAIGEEVRCDVRDDGCGIAPSDLPHVFEPFFTTKPPGRGTGLGLSVCYGILKSHGGKIEVDSKPGQGASFRLTLPACSTAGAVVDEARSCKPPTFGS